MILELAALILASYRLSLLVSEEDGPGYIFRKLRNEVPKKSSAHKGIRCQWCVSVWVAILFTSYAWARPYLPNVVSMPFDFLICVLALSAGSLILNQIFTKG